MPFRALSALVALVHRLCPQSTTRIITSREGAQWCFFVEAHLAANGRGVLGVAGWIHERTWRNKRRPIWIVGVASRSDFASAYPSA